MIGKNLRKTYHTSSTWLHHHSMVLLFGLLTVGSMFGRQLGSSLQQEHQAYAASTLNCSTASNINVPVVECEALLDLYDSTNGGGWNNSNNWDTDSDICDWHGIQCTNVAGQNRVWRITLPWNNLQGTLPVSLSALTELTYFNTYTNQLTGQLRSDWSEWTKIHYFNVGVNQITGSLPPERGVWTGINYFYVAGNKLHGTLPPERATWTNIDQFYAGSNHITGTFPVERSTWTGIKRFYIGGNNLNGTLPIEREAWTNIEHFLVFGNNLTGILPVEWETWINIQGFNLQSNQISGTLPVEWETWTNINTFNVGFNQVSGTLPVEWETWINMYLFNITNNQISGTLPTERSVWSNIGEFNVQDNNLEGTLPVERSVWSNIQSFRVGSNSLTGTLPTERSVWSNIGEFNVQDNNLIGLIPDSRATNRLSAYLVNMTYNCLQTIGYNPTTQTWIDNNVTLFPQSTSCGPIVTLSGGANITIQSGGVFVDPGALRSDDTDGTGFIATATSGTVDPYTLGSYLLEYSYVNTLGITGSTTRTVEIVANLCQTRSNYNVPLVECEAVVDLYNSTNGANWTNNTNWMTDTDICTWYGISCTDITGETRVAVLNLQENQLNGTLPASLSALELLNYFDVSRNNLTGSLSPERSTWTDMQYFYVNNNQISGVLPPERSTWTNMREFVVGFNDLEGTLPSAWSTWTGILTIFVQDNNLTGLLPTEWSALTTIQDLRLQNNNLSGPIPDSWADNRTSMTNGNVINNCLDTTGYNPTTQTWIDNNITLLPQQSGCKNADLFVTKQTEAINALLGSIIEYTITYYNNGPDTAQNVTIYETPGDNISVISGSIDYTIGEMAYGIQGDICADNLLANNNGPYADALNQWAISVEQAGFSELLYILLQEAVDDEEMTEEDRNYRVINRGQFVIEMIPGLAGSVEQWFNEIGIDISTIDPSCGTAVQTKTYGGEGDICAMDLVTNDGLYVDILNQWAIDNGPILFPGETINNFPDILYFFLQENVDNDYMTEGERQEAIDNRGQFIVYNVGPGLGGLTNRFQMLNIINQLDPSCGEINPTIQFIIGDIPVGSGGTITMTAEVISGGAIATNTVFISSNAQDANRRNNGYITSIELQNFCGDGSQDNYFSGNVAGEIIDVSAVHMYHQSGWRVDDTTVILEIKAELSGGQVASGYERNITSQNIDNPLDMIILGSNTGDVLTVQLSGTDLMLPYDYIVHPIRAYTISATITTTEGHQITNNVVSWGGVLLFYILPTNISYTGSSVEYNDYTIFSSSYELGSNISIQNTNISDNVFFDNQGSILSIIKFIGYDLYNNGIVDIIIPSDLLFTTVQHHYTSFTGSHFITQVGRQPDRVNVMSQERELVWGTAFNQDYMNAGILFTTTETILGTYIQEECDGEEFCSSQCTIITSEEAFCGDGEINQESEQCDDGPNGSENCNTSCETIYTNPPTTYTCTLTANPSSGNRPLATIFTLNMSGSDIVPAYTSYIVYGDGTTGTSLQHTYNNANTYTAVGHIIFENEDITPISCNTTITVTQPGCVNCGGGETPTTNNSPTHQSAPEIKPLEGRACIYNDEDYLARGPFTDTFGHRGFDYMDVMRISCLHRGRGTNKGLWIYEPDANITRAEVLKTVVKILGAEFDDLSITNESLLYTGMIPFADVANNNWFAHYANYAYSKGLTVGLRTVDAKGDIYINPDQIITRYEAIKVIMLAYQYIHNKTITISTATILGDVIDSTNPYYKYIREAEILGFISGVPQIDGGYNFEGQRHITRAEFAKIAGVPFADQLFDVEDIVLSSDIYSIIIQGINRSAGDKNATLNTIISQLLQIESMKFIQQFKIEKQIFLETLHKLVTQQIAQ